MAKENRRLNPSEVMRNAKKYLEGGMPMEEFSRYARRAPVSALKYARRYLSDDDIVACCFSRIQTKRDGFERIIDCEVIDRMPRHIVEEMSYVYPKYVALSAPERLSDKRLSEIAHLCSEMAVMKLSHRLSDEVIVNLASKFPWTAMYAWADRLPYDVLVDLCLRFPLKCFSSGVWTRLKREDLIRVCKRRPEVTFLHAAHSVPRDVIIECALDFPDVAVRFAGTDASFRYLLGEDILDFCKASASLGV